MLDVVCFCFVFSPLTSYVLYQLFYWRRCQQTTIPFNVKGTTSTSGNSPSTSVELDDVAGKVSARQDSTNAPRQKTPGGSRGRNLRQFWEETRSSLRLSPQFIRVSFKDLHDTPWKFSVPVSLGSAWRDDDKAK